MKRKRGVNEPPSKKKAKEKKRIMHCGQCKSTEHNIRFHKNDKALGESFQATDGSSQSFGPTQDSQGSLTQA
ncbi:unnamed protein product [Arabis nemorensis]|uniref:Uncharacterized protein n=1 Tax=Arabis nemorensis TaxID=586526 RepID=A0A565BG36_9BRAS|nr:unnamed protein product [Arabis nemorensis]